MTVAKGVDFRWIAKKYLPKGVTDLLRAVLPESVYYPSYGKTTLSNKKLDQLLKLLHDCLSRRVEGDLIECGVFRGGSLAEIARMTQTMAPSKQVFGADTFEGHPFDSPEDVPPDNQLVHRKGLFAGNNFDRVGAMLKESELTNTSLLKGMVGETLPALGDRKFCFVHLDMDLYISTKQALKYLEPRLVSGGVLVLDDYGGYETPGVAQAVSEVVPHATIQHSPIDPSEGSQGYWIKP